MEFDIAIMASFYRKKIGFALSVASPSPRASTKTCLDS
jgi:hypothetical protein